MNTHEIVALAIVAVRLSHRRDNRTEARDAIRAFRSATHAFTGTMSPDMREACRAVTAAERKVSRW